MDMPEDKSAVEEPDGTRAGAGPGCNASSMGNHGAGQLADRHHCGGCPGKPAGHRVSAQEPVNYEMQRTVQLCKPCHCGSVAEVDQESMLQKLDRIIFTDSKVVLGYINNESQRFYVYVHNHVSTYTSTHPEQWRYVPTEKNSGRSRNKTCVENSITHQMTFTLSRLIQPQMWKLQPKDTSLVTRVTEKRLNIKQFEHFMACVD
ncbi:hypothetical protein L3Q82_019198 [Scortum barcoo]|uniref:Uncharacterized protein n=1 Tax=Scortum barcoo TaxID=214431 RepID=A0ACB8VGR1_9TELE|nr:hypothetical protein L3Q82_019198 [Scortum barcoo]